MSLTKESLAAMLNGREYSNEITEEECKAAKAAGIVIIFGYSDDNVELRGAINDEVGAYDVTTFNLDRKGVVKSWDEIDHDDEDACADYFARKGKGVKVEAKWCEEGYSWFITAGVPFAAFDIMEDGEKFCRGIVIDVRDISGKEGV